MTTPEYPGPTPENSRDPQQPTSPADAKRQAREAKAVAKANRNWFARHKFLTGAGVLVVLIGIISVASGGGDDEPTATAETSVSQDDAATTADEATTDDADAADDTSADDAADDAAADDAADEATTISGGDHIVGTDIDPGQYRADVSESLFSLCSVTQQNGDDVLDIRTANEGSVIFTVADVDGSTVSFDGCDNIVSTADQPGTVPDAYTNGDWLVGAEIEPGKYQGTVDPDAAIVLGSVSQTNGTDVLDITTGDEGKVVFDVQDTEGSVVSFSGLTDIQKVG
ncbi:hypothetical protein CLV28_2986 [Sediminihabitans luteus]|uniref:Uncharacterized protein n=1 Tax=Sediminihabitans luteus TaxID=1138585 RepID=A0A2M9CC31_9CELL|nr:hypothetical protein [Sediminihabitans luteus]PJJ68570.1 hypothetical protein CLV28_2986 [Sediminihabitans luteus]